MTIQKSAIQESVSGNYRKDWVEMETDIGKIRSDALAMIKKMRASSLITIKNFDNGVIYCEGTTMILITCFNIKTNKKSYYDYKVRESFYEMRGKILNAVGNYREHIGKTVEFSYTESKFIENIENQRFKILSA